MLICRIKPYMRHFLEWFERFMYIALIVFLIVVLVFTLLELGWLMAIGLFGVSTFRLENQEVLELFGYFLLILIGLELLQTIRVYLERREFHVEIILLVAIIAIARKVILLGTETSGELIGIALVIIALCGGYFLIRRAGIPYPFSQDSEAISSERRE